MEQNTLLQVIQNKLDKKFADGKAKIEDFVVKFRNEMETAEDYLTPFGRRNAVSGGVEFTSNGHLRMLFADHNLPLNPHAVTQLGEKLGIPTQYLRKLADNDNQEQRDLAAHLLNSHCQWMGEDKRYLIRTSEREIRGVLSDSYKRINSKTIMNAFFDQVTKSDGKIADACLTPTRYWMEALIPFIIPVPTEKNGIIYMAFGVRIGNSDFGDGALDIRSFMLQPICRNGLVKESLMNKIHLGSKLGDDLQLSQETYDLESKMMASAVKDITKLALNESQIRTNIALIQQAAGTSVDLDREFLNLSTRSVNKSEIVEISKIMAQSDPDDGIFGEATLWSLTQGITAYGRNIGGRRERELAQIAGELMDRSKPSMELQLVS